MGVFDQMGDPVCPACLCEHHGAAYAEVASVSPLGAVNVNYNTVADGATIVQAQIVTTERCCIVANAATIIGELYNATAMEIERPVGTLRTTQEDELLSADIKLTHHAAWEVLPAGTYTYYLVNRLGTPLYPFATWLKIIASDCEG